MRYAQATVALSPRHPRTCFRAIRPYFRQTVPSPSVTVYLLTREALVSHLFRHTLNLQFSNHTTIRQRALHPTPPMSPKWPRRTTPSRIN